MATGGKRSGAFVEATGSEAVFERICEPCSDEKTKEAFGFCLDCGDWLCDECYWTHTRPRTSRNHELMTSEEVRDSNAEEVEDSTKGLATGGDPPKDVFVEATGSEAVFERICELCSDEKTIEAFGFCLNCGDWLCDECYWAHTRRRTSRNHELMTAEEVRDSNAEEVEDSTKGLAKGGDPPKDVFVEATGSEAVFERTCELCRDEKTIEAFGFCLDCRDWLCDECYWTHTRPRTSRNHQLMTVEELRESTAEEFKDSTEGIALADNYTERCGMHDGKCIEYFCKDHDFLGCSKCIEESHRACKAQNILDISTDATFMTEFQQTKLDLEAFAKRSEDLAIDVEKKIALVKLNKKETVKAFRKYKKELVELLDKIEVALEDSCSRKVKEETVKLEKISESWQELEKASLQIKGRLEVYEDRGDHCKMFVAMKRGRNKLKDSMSDSFRKAQCSSSVTLYTFQPNLKTGEILKIPQALGILVEKGQLKSDTDYVNISANYLTDIAIKSKGEYTCGITSSVLLPGHKLVVTDLDNNEVKVIDTNKNKMLTKTKINGHPWAVCRISDSSVAVTIWNKNRLMFLSVGSTGKLARIKTLAFRDECYGVASTGDKIIVTYLAPMKIEIMDMNGSILSTLEENHQGQQLLAWPEFVSFSRDRKSLYVSNYINHTVTCMSQDGTVTAEYKDDDLRGPEQTAVDSNGMVYVCGRISNNVHLITPDCRKIKVLLNAFDGLSGVFAVSFCEESNRLYIGMDECDVIKVFELT